ncbi:MAG: branched-chain amino acid ABC transporter permease [Chloroflexi bacterium 13_1_40CM_4_69_19]|nr:MAG: branched-chain amino acid ABC transporter permease [Chloroflexi bacterium 13_1_40CM_4_69_19]
MSPELTLVLQLLIGGVAIGGVYALIALGFVLIYKATDVLNLAQGEMLLLGAYVSYGLIAQIGLPVPVAFLITLAFSIVLGITIERVALRPLIGEPAISVIMVTIGLAILLRSIVIGIWGTEYRVYPDVLPKESAQIGPLSVSLEFLWSFGIAMALVALFALAFRYTRVGIAMRAVADDQQAALSMGINVRFVFATSWVIAAIVSSIGGILLASIQGTGILLATLGLKALPVAIVGGLDSIIGAAVGGVIVGVLETLSAGYLDVPLGGGVRDVAPFVFLVLILLVKPYGLFGKERIERV